MQEFVHLPNAAIFPQLPTNPALSSFLQPQTDHEFSTPGL